MTFHNLIATLIVLFCFLVPYFDCYFLPRVNKFSLTMSAEWKPPAKIEELFAKTGGNQFASINAPTAGARTQQALPEGSAPLQLYSLATPNGNLK